MLLHYIQFFMNSYVWDWRSNDQCFSNGPNFVLPNFKKGNKKGKKVWVLPNIDLEKKKLTQKKGWKFIECSLYIFFWTKIKLYPFK